MDIISELGKIRVELLEEVDTLKFKIGNRLSELQQKISDKK